MRSSTLAFPEGNLSYPAELRAQHLAAVSGERGRLYFKRQRILELGPVAVHFFTELVHQRPRTWKGDLEKLYRLLNDIGEDPLARPPSGPPAGPHRGRVRPGSPRRPGR
jgi:hypothetical protein